MSKLHEDCDQINFQAKEQGKKNNIDVIRERRTVKQRKKEKKGGDRWGSG